MSRNDLRGSEKRWQRKRLFGKQPSYSAPRIVAILLFLVALAALAWWLKIPLFDFLSEQMVLSGQSLS